MRRKTSNTKIIEIAKGSKGIPWLPGKKDGSRGIFVYTARKTERALSKAMPIFSNLMFQAVHWAARRGLREEENPPSESKKQEARRTGVRGETYAYWYLRRQGYVFVARNYTPRGVKGEIDLVGYDGGTLAFVEVRTRTVRADMAALPELSVTRDKQYLVARTAQRFLAERHIGECSCRFDVLAIDNKAGQPPVVRLHKDAFSPRM
jgi:putative endonuclease